MGDGEGGKRSQGGWREVGQKTVVGPRWIDGIFFTEGEREGDGVTDLIRSLWRHLQLSFRTRCSFETGNKNFKLDDCFIYV